MNLHAKKQTKDSVVRVQMDTMEQHVNKVCKFDVIKDIRKVLPYTQQHEYFRALAMRNSDKSHFLTYHHNGAKVCSPFLFNVNVDQEIQFR